MRGRGCLLLDNLEDLLEARLETASSDTGEETPAITLVHFGRHEDREHRL